MVQIQKDESTAAKRRILIKLVDETDCITPETGVISPTIQVSKNGASPSSGAGSWNEIDSVNMPGLYYYELTAGEVDTEGLLIVNVVKSGVSREFTKEIEIVTQTSIDVSEIWDYLTSSITTSGSIGKLLKDDIDATISSRAPASEYDSELNRILGLSDENCYIDEYVYSNGKHTSCRKRIYNSAANAQAHGSTGLLATYRVTITWSGNKVSTYMMVLE